MKISFLTDNPNSWIIEYLNLFMASLESHNVNHYFNHKDINDHGDILFILSCEEIVKEEVLKFHKKNIVIHPSKLPKGKGWSPISWQVLEGLNIIPITLFEAVDKVDSGDIYLQDEIVLEGHELNNEIKHKQAVVTFNLISKFIKNYPYNPSKSQHGESSFYKKRNKSSNELDVNKSIKEQFNLLRIVDNERYPAFFYLKNKKYIIKITKDE